MSHGGFICIHDYIPGLQTLHSSSGGQPAVPSSGVTRSCLFRHVSPSQELEHFDQGRQALTEQPEFVSLCAAPATVASNQIRSMATERVLRTLP
jgi:hypothetical protein